MIKAESSILLDPYFLEDVYSYLYRNRDNQISSSSTRLIIWLSCANVNLFASTAAAGRLKCKTGPYDDGSVKNVKR